MSLLQLLLYLLLGALGCFIYWLRRQLTYWQSRGIACDAPNWALGSFQGVRASRSYGDVWMQTYKKFKGTGPFCGFYWFQKPAVLVLERELAKNVLINDFEKFTDRGFFTNEKDDPLTGLLFLLQGERWRSMRSKLSPTFTSAKMKCMFPAIMQVAEEFLLVFRDAVRQNCVVEVKDMLARFTIDVIGSCAFGIDCSSLREPETEFHRMAKKIFEERYGNMGNAFVHSFPDICRCLRFKFFPDAVIDFFIRVIRATAEYRELHNIKRNDFFNILLEMKNSKVEKTEDGTEPVTMTIENMAAQAVFFIFAGFETSSLLMGFCLYELAQHQDIQERARQEVLSTLQKHNHELTYECIMELQYLEQIICETLRLYTILPILNRQAIEDYVVPGHPKYVIKKGMNVLIPNSGFHRDPDIFANPESFNPENFSAEKVQARDCVDFIPFGVGPRSCIGRRFGKMQIRIGLALLLSNFKFAVCSKTTIPMEYDKENFLIASKDGIYLQVEEIH